MKPTRVVAAFAIVLLVGAALIAYRDRAAERRDAAPGKAETLSGTPTEIAPAAAAVSSSDVGGKPDSEVCVAGRRFDAAVVEATNRESVVALEIEEARARLLASQDPEHLATAALLARGAADRVADVTNAMTIGRQNPVVVWAAVHICEAARAEVDCPAREWEAELLRLDGANSEAWIHVAATRWRRGEITAALEATQRAAASAETRVYWPETVEMIERALASTGGYSFQSRVAVAFGYAVTITGPDSSAPQMCIAQSKASPVWAETCLEYGRLVERQDSTDMSQTIAQGIQIAALEAIGRDPSDVIARRDRARRELYEAADRAATVMITTPVQFSTYLTTLREEGEAAAREYLIESADPFPQCAAEK